MSESEIAQIVERLKSIEEKVDDLTARQDQWSGAVGMGKWLFASLLGALGLAFMGFREFR